jgi:choline dehydrogenase-like flavoprotein
LTIIKKKVVIIGGGTAGLTIANSIQRYFHVTVLEKSNYSSYPIWYKVPLLIGILLRKKISNYISVRNIHLSNGRVVPFFESNVLGGASVINGCVHMLGNKKNWNSILKKFNCDYNDIIDSYKKIYTADPKAKNKINLKYASQNIIDKGFIEALNNNGIPNGDMNFSDNESCGRILNTSKRFFRTSVISFFGKKKFKTYLGEDVQNILFDDVGKVTGVKTSKRKLNADYVILSAGVIGTNKLLLEQKNKNCSLKHIMVGNDVKDHTNLRVNIKTNKKIDSLNEISDSLFKKLAMCAKFIHGSDTLMSGTGATSAAHLDLDDDGEVDTRIQIVQFSELGRHGSSGKLFSTNEPGFSISITLINPKSSGFINSEENGVSVNPCYLSSSEDIDLLKLALKFCLDLLKSEPLNRHILKVEDESLIQKNPKKYIFDNIYSGYHLIGGSHENINSNFEVTNTKGFYICDASIFNDYPASNIHSSVVLISDVFAEKFINYNLQD